MRSSTTLGFGTGLSCALLAGAISLSGGCNENPEPQVPAQPQVQAPQPPQGVEKGPMTNQAKQGGGSALGGAKRVAGNIVQQAEEASKRSAEDPPKDD